MSAWRQTIPTLPSPHQSTFRVFARRPPASHQNPLAPRPLHPALPKITPHRRTLVFRDTSTPKPAQTALESKLLTGTPDHANSNRHPRGSKPRAVPSTPRQRQGPRHHRPRQSPRQLPAPPPGPAPRRQPGPQPRRPSPFRRSQRPQPADPQNVCLYPHKSTPETPIRSPKSCLYSCKTNLTPSPSTTCRHPPQPECNFSIPVKHP